MKRAFALPILLVFLAGCPTINKTSTATERWVAGNTTLIATQDTIKFMGEHKLLTDEEGLKTEKWIKAARASLDEAEKQLPSGGAKFEDMMAIAAAAIKELETTKAEVTNGD